MNAQKGTMSSLSENLSYGYYAPTGWRARFVRWTRAMPDTWLGRRIAYTLRRRAMKGLQGPVDVESFGARFRLYPYDNVCEKRILFTPQYFDAPERTLLERYAAGKAGFTFIDIGANVGGYALFVAALAGAGARVLALEPQPLIFKRLCQNIQQNPEHCVKAIACAVADKDGEVTLFLDRDNRGETGLRFVRPEHRGDGAIIVPSRTLMSLVHEENLTRIDALKLDVEGAEDLIMEPFLHSAPDSLLPGLIIVEDGRERWQSDLVGMLEGRGYTRILQTRLNLVYERVIPVQG
jgi:FkbM family methyltransferase